MLVEGCKHALDITIPVAEVDQETERAAVAIQGKARLPGFRPGKAPLSIVKTRFAGVPAAMIATHGPVSEPVARALAEGIRNRTEASIGVGITGIALAQRLAG